MSLVSLMARSSTVKVMGMRVSSRLGEACKLLFYVIAVFGVAEGKVLSLG